MDIFSKAFNHELKYKLISVVGGNWGRYFFVVEVKPYDLYLINDAGDSATLSLNELIVEGIAINVIDLPELPQPLQGIRFAEHD